MTASTRHSPIDAKPEVLVALCADLKKSAPWLDLTALSSWLSSHSSGVEVVVAGDLCHEPCLLEDLLSGVRFQRLVLALCSPSGLGTELQNQVRKSGIDPIGVQAVDLTKSDGRSIDGKGANTWAKSILMAAVARARAFHGAKPENLKAVLPLSQGRVSRRSLFTLPALSYVAVPTIDRSLCAADAGCDQCVGACPQAALEKDGSRITVNPSQCSSCGRCATVCPQRAVEFPGFSPAEIEAQVSALLDDQSPLEKPRLAFTCRQASSHNSGEDQVVVPVSCLSSVSAGAVLGSLAHGAKSVALVSCGQQCTNGQADKVQGTVDYCRKLLRSLGDPSWKDRVATLTYEGTKSLENGLQLPGRKPDGPLRLFGSGTTSRYVLNLAERLGREDSVLDHPHSPLGLVRVDLKACTGCGTCAIGCPTKALATDTRDGKVELSFDPALCIGCGECTTLCPEENNGAITFTKSTDLQKLASGRQVLFQSREVLCKNCGAPVATQEMLERISSLLGENYIPELMGDLCTDCRGLGWNT